MPDAAVANQDLQSLIQTAARPDEGQPAPADAAPSGESAPLGEIANSLVQLMQADPSLAAKVADLIEQHYSGGGEGMVEAGNVQPAAAPVSVPPAPEPAAPAAAAQAPAQVPPEFVQRLAALEQAIEQMQRPLADYQLDRELAQLRQMYDRYRQHYGDVLPEKFDDLERPVLEKYQAILEGRIPPHELAFRMALDEVLHKGDTPLRDRILAAVARQAPQAPRVEGTGGMAAAAEEKPPIPRTTAERMERLKELYRTLLQNPGE